jgi:hypothetical protein
MRIRIPLFTLTWIRVSLFTSMQIRILLLVKAMRICNYETFIAHEEDIKTKLPGGRKNLRIILAINLLAGERKRKAEVIRKKSYGPQREITSQSVHIKYIFSVSRGSVFGWIPQLLSKHARR